MTFLLTYWRVFAIAAALAAATAGGAYQIIQEGNWIHVSADTRMRGIVLTAHFDNGKATYTAGA